MTENMGPAIRAAIRTILQAWAHGRIELNGRAPHFTATDREIADAFRVLIRATAGTVPGDPPTDPPT